MWKAVDENESFNSKAYRGTRIVVASRLGIILVFILAITAISTFLYGVTHKNEVVRVVGCIIMFLFLFAAMILTIFRPQFGTSIGMSKTQRNISRIGIFFIYIGTGLVLLGFILETKRPDKTGYYIMGAGGAVIFIAGLIVTTIAITAGVRKAKRREEYYYSILATEGD